jgi:hypothetical protein
LILDGYCQSPGLKRDITGNAFKLGGIKHEKGSSRTMKPKAGCGALEALMKGQAK